MRIIPVLTAAGLAGALLTGCGDGDRSEGGQLRVAAGLAPLAEVAERVGGDRVEVENVTPAGAEPHDLELSPDQVADLDDAEVILVLGRGFQPAVEEVADGSDGVVVEVLDQLGVEGEDPHVWLDPVLMRGIVDATAAGLTEADPEGADVYEANASAFRQELDDLDERYGETLATCERRLLVTAHDAFGRLAARYDLEHEGIAGVAPETEPDPRRLAELADLVEDEGVTTVFTEELVSPRVAQSLAREAGVKTDVLDPIESLGEDASYLSAMEDNLAAIAAALGCG